MSKHSAEVSTVTRVLQRQILQTQSDSDVFRLYVDPEAAVLDADKYEVGSNRTAQQLLDGEGRHLSPRVSPGDDPSRGVTGRPPSHGRRV